VPCEALRAVGYNCAMYDVEWTEAAVSDLRTKVTTPGVRRHLLTVARTALDRHRPPWGGRSTEWLWRRGVTARDEAVLSATPDADADVHPDADTADEHAYDFVLVYHRLLVPQVPRRYQVLAVLTNDDLLAALGSSVIPAPPTLRSGPARVTRPRGGAGGRR
jgi:hypothetical protein